MTDYTNSYTNLINTVWSQKINAGLNKSCVMLQCVNKDYQPDVDKGARTINIAVPDAVSVATYSGTISSYSEATTTQKQLVMSKNLYFGFTVPDIDQVQSNVNIIDAISEKAKKAVGEEVEKYLFTKSADTPIDNTTGSTTTPSSVATTALYSKFVELAKTLKTTGALTAEKGGWVVIHPDVEEKLLLCDEFTSASNTSDSAIKEGAVGRIAGLDVYVSPNVGKETNYYDVLAGTKDAITYASQISKIEQLRAESSFDTIVRGLYTFGAVTVNPNALARLIFAFAS